MRHLAPASAVAVVLAASLWTFAPVTGHAFLNWDDPEVVVANDALQRPWPALVAWAFTTRHMGHYQPLTWLAYAGTGSPPRAEVVHTVALALHALNAALLLGLIARWLGPSSDDSRWWVALGAAALFAVHPLRVEPVAWASALPYLLSYVPLLLSMVAWIAWTRTDAAQARWMAVALFAGSQLARVTAPLWPAALFAIARVVPGGRMRSTATLLREIVPFVCVAVPLAALEALARDPAPLSEIGVATRVTWAIAHPAAYAWRSVMPGPLNPLDALPRVAPPEWDVAIVAALATIAVVALTAVLASARAAWAVWGTFALLLAPVVGLVPSGLQRTADRYAYGPGMVLAVALAVVVQRLAHRGARGAALVAMGGAGVAYALSAREQLPMWQDSVALWSRAVAIDDGNDVALYNLALAEIDARRPDAAIDHLQRLVALVPDHDLGRQRLTQLVADRETRAADALAQQRRFVEAVAAYDRALDADPARTKARVGRGMSLVELGRLAPAAQDLGIAVEAGMDDVPIVSALAYAWASTGRAAEALALLRRELAANPGHFELTGNLARLLVTAEPPSLRSPDEALALATRLNDTTGGNDIRVLDTLALALAATGRTREAADALAVAIALADDAGNRALAADLSARRRSVVR